jgi:hypothetical protein
VLQKPTDEQSQDYFNDKFARIDKDVNAIVKARNIPPVHEDDLQQCLDMLRDRSDMEFHWDTEMYNAHADSSGILSISYIKKFL